MCYTLITMKRLRHHSKNIFLLLAAIALIFISLFGIIHASSDMQMNGKGHMTGCFFDGHTELCTMTLIEHIQTWRNLFTARPLKYGTFFVLLLGLAFAWFFSFRRHYLFDAKRIMRQKFRYFQRFVFPFSSLLQEAFSQGILNPKIYESAAL